MGDGGRVNDANDTIQMASCTNNLATTRMTGYERGPGMGDVVRAKRLLRNQCRQCRPKDYKYTCQNREPKEKKPGGDSNAEDHRRGACRSTGTRGASS